MINPKTAILAKRRRAELEALSIDPVSYHIVSKFLNKNISYIIKQDSTEVFLYWINLNEFPYPPESQVTTNELKRHIEKMFGMPRGEVISIVAEWLRDREIYHHLTEEAVKHWDILNVPILYGTHDEYNF